MIKNSNLSSQLNMPLLTGRPVASCPPALNVIFPPVKQPGQNQIISDGPSAKLFPPCPSPFTAPPPMLPHLESGLHHGMARVDVACGVLRSSFHLKKNLMAGFAARFPCLSLQLVFCRHHLVWEMHSGHSTFLISHFRGVSPWE